MKPVTKILETCTDPTGKTHIIVMFDGDVGAVVTHINHDVNIALTPKQLRKVGHWIIIESVRLGRKYADSDFRDR